MKFNRRQAMLAGLAAVATPVISKAAPAAGGRAKRASRRKVVLRGLVRRTDKSGKVFTTGVYRFADA
jgi:hypothetical protein